MSHVLDQGERTHPHLVQTVLDGQADGMTSSMHDIVRTSRRNGTPVWRATVHRSGRHLHLIAADDMFGGEAAALAVAQAWRDAVLAHVPSLTRHGAVPGGPAGPNLPGLYLLPARGTRQAAWMGRVVPPGGRPMTRSFSIARHGDAEARALAEAWVRTEAAKVESAAIPVPPPPCSAADDDEAARYGIARVVDPRGRGYWQVIVLRASRRIQASFPDLTYGGERPALAVARAWRDAVMAVVPPLTNIAMRQIVRRNRQGGMPGVYYDPRRDAWSAIVTLAGKRTIKRSFKVALYGDEARALAEAERLRMLDDLDDGRHPALRNEAARAAARRDFEPDATKPILVQRARPE